MSNLDAFRFSSDGPSALWRDPAAATGPPLLAWGNEAEVVHAACTHQLSAAGLLAWMRTLLTADMGSLKMIVKPCKRHDWIYFVVMPSANDALRLAEQLNGRHFDEMAEVLGGLHPWADGGAPPPRRHSKGPNDRMEFSVKRIKNRTPPAEPGGGWQGWGAVGKVRRQLYAAEDEGVEEDESVAAMFHGLALAVESCEQRSADKAVQEACSLFAHKPVTALNFGEVWARLRAHGLLHSSPNHAQLRTDELRQKLGDLQREGRNKSGPANALLKRGKQLLKQRVAGKTPMSTATSCLDGGGGTHPPLPRPRGAPAPCQGPPRLARPTESARVRPQEGGQSLSPATRAFGVGVGPQPLGVARAPTSNPGRGGGGKRKAQAQAAPQPARTAWQAAHRPSKNPKKKPANNNKKVVSNLLRLTNGKSKRRKTHS